MSICTCIYVHVPNICYVSHVLYRTQCVSISTHHHSELWGQQAYIGAYQYCTTHLINCARSEVHASVYTYTWLCIIVMHVICRNYLTHVALIRNLIIVWIYMALVMQYWTLLSTIDNAVQWYLHTIMLWCNNSMNNLASHWYTLKAGKFIQFKCAGDSHNWPLTQ